MGTLTPVTSSAPEKDGNDASFKEMLATVKVYVNYLKSKWLWIMLLVMLGAGVGYLYCKFSKSYYVADCTFVLDEESGAKSNGLAALGLGVSKGGDFFAATDNIVWLYSTRLMLQKTLLSSVDTGSAGNKKVLLINWFMAESGLWKKEFSKNRDLKNIRFSESDTLLSRGQNAIIGRCAGLIKGAYLKVQLTPKTQNVIGVSFKSQDELFSEAFAQKLVSTVNSYYIQTKTKKAAAEVALLEQKASQYKSSMSSEMYEVASGYDDAPYANPNRQVLRVEPQRKQVDAKISGEIYGGLVQQLEMSRTVLQKQMPLIQIIEEPVLPLNVTGPNLIMAVVLGAFVAGFLALASFLAVFQLKKMTI